MPGRDEVLVDPLLVRLVLADHDHAVLLAVAVLAGVGAGLVSLRRIEDAGERVGVEAEALGVEAAGGNRLELDRQQLVVPLGTLGGGVVGEAVRPDLLGGEVRGRLPYRLRTGTVSRPSFWAAFSRVWPATTTPSASTTIGCLNPKRRMLSATASTASSLSRGLPGYGRMESMDLACTFTRRHLLRGTDTGVRRRGRSRLGAGGYGRRAARKKVGLGVRFIAAVTTAILAW